MKSARFKPGDKGFEGAGEQLSTGGRGKPVEFAEDDEADPFGLDQVHAHLGLSRAHT